MLYSRFSLVIYFIHSSIYETLSYLISTRTLQNRELSFSYINDILQFIPLCFGLQLLEFMIQTYTIKIHIAWNSKLRVGFSVDRITEPNMLSRTQAPLVSLCNHTQFGFQHKASSLMAIRCLPIATEHTSLFTCKGSDREHCFWRLSQERKADFPRTFQWDSSPFLELH